MENRADMMPAAMSACATDVDQARDNCKELASQAAQTAGSRDELVAKAIQDALDEFAAFVAAASGGAVHDPNIHPGGLHEGHTPQTRAQGTPLIEFRDFCFAYEDVATLRHIDLAINAGDSVVLMGYNGSGKSTLLKAINGLVFAAQGSYLFDGRAVTEASMKDAGFAKQLHQRVGFIFQDSDAQLFCPSVEDEVAFGPRQMGLAEDEVQRRVDDVCALVGIEHLRARAPYHLSGGEKKKVSLACIMSMNPDVYCFDEPLNGLDIPTRDWLLETLHQLKAAGKTLVIATHDQSLADALADYFVYMGPTHEYGHKPHVHVNM